MEQKHLKGCSPVFFPLLRLDSQVNQGYGAVTVYLVDPDHLDVDPLKNIKKMYIQMQKNIKNTFDNRVLYVIMKK